MMLLAWYSRSVMNCKDLHAVRRGMKIGTGAWWNIA